MVAAVILTEWQCSAARLVPAVDVFVNFCRLFCTRYVEDIVVSCKCCLTYHTMNRKETKRRKLKVARAFLWLPALDFWSVRYSHWILSIRWICSVMLCLFCSCTCGGPHMSVAFWVPLTIPSLSPFSVSPSGAEAFPPQELRYRDSKISSLVFLFPCIFFHVFALLFGWFWSIAAVLWSCSCSSSKLIPFSVHEISLVDMMFGFIQLDPGHSVRLCSFVCSL